MMIAATSKNGKSVRLNASYFLDTERAYYEVSCSGTRFEFNAFGPAARVYKKLSEVIEDGGDVEARLKTLVNGARVLGFTVKEVA